MEHLLARKGAARIALIPPEVLQALNAGRIPTVNLNEFLALDLPLRARNVARDIGLDPQSERLQDTLAMLPAFAPMKRHLHDAARTQPEWVREGVRAVEPGEGAAADAVHRRAASAAEPACGVAGVRLRLTASLRNATRPL